MISDTISEDERFSELWYEFKFYGMFLSDITNTIKECFAETIDHCKSEFSKKVKGEKDVVLSVFDNIAKRYLSAVDQHAAVLHNTVKNNLRIKRNILLPEDEIYKTFVSESEETEVEERLKCLRRRYFALLNMVRKFEALRKELGDYNQSKMTSNDITNFIRTFNDD